MHAAALNLLAAEGVSSLSVDRLAEVSGVSRSTIYRHWPDMRALIVAAFDEVVHGDPGADLLDYLHDYARRLNDPTYAAVIIAVMEWSWRDPAFADGAQQDLRRHPLTRRGDPARRRGVGTAARRPDVTASVEDVVAPFLYRRLVLRRAITAREVDALHRRLLDRFGAAA